MNNVARLIAQACDIMRSHGVVRAMLFGSQANGHATASSDIDIAFWPGSAFTIHDYFDMLDELDELDTLRSWDLVDMSAVTADSVIEREVRDHGIELFPQTGAAA